jgi:hypothetical protein
MRMNTSFTVAAAIMGLAVKPRQGRTRPISVTCSASKIRRLTSAEIGG